VTEFVVDASVAAKWFLNDERHIEEATAVANDTHFSPHEILDTCAVGRSFVLPDSPSHVIPAKAGIQHWLS